MITRHFIGNKNITTSIPDNEIWYTATSQVIPSNASVFGANYLPDESEFDEATGKGILKFDNSVTSIGNYTFSHFFSLTSITIPNSVTNIGKEAFWMCMYLTSITIPNSVTSIGDRAFASCFSLPSINVDANNPNYCSIDGVLFNKDKTTLVAYPGGKQGAYTIPNSITSIGNSAFWECSSLTSVTIPNSVKSIGEEAFSGCKSLTSVYVESETPPIIGNKVFTYDVANNNYKPLDITIYVPYGTIETYKAAYRWNYYADKILPIP